MTSYRTNTANWKYVYNGNAFRDTVAEYIILIILALSLFQEWSSSCLWQTFLYSILPIHTTRVRSVTYYSTMVFLNVILITLAEKTGREKVNISLFLNFTTKPNIQIIQNILVVNDFRFLRSLSVWKQENPEEICVFKQRDNMAISDAGTW